MIGRVASFKGGLGDFRFETGFGKRGTERGTGSCSFLRAIHKRGMRNSRAMALGAALSFGGLGDWGLRDLPRFDGLGFGPGPWGCTGSAVKDILGLLQILEVPIGGPSSYPWASWGLAADVGATTSLLLGGLGLIGRVPHSWSWGGIGLKGAVPLGGTTGSLDHSLIIHPWLPIRHDLPASWTDDCPCSRILVIFAGAFLSHEQDS